MASNSSSGKLRLAVSKEFVIYEQWNSDFKGDSFLKGQLDCQRVLGSMSANTFNPINLKPSEDRMYVIIFFKALINSYAF